MSRFIIPDARFVEPIRDLIMGLEDQGQSEAFAIAELINSVGDSVFYDRDDHDNKRGEHIRLAMLDSVDELIIQAMAVKQALIVVALVKSKEDS